MLPKCSIKLVGRTVSLTRWANVCSSVKFIGGSDGFSLPVISNGTGAVPRFGLPHSGMFSTTKIFNGREWCDKRLPQPITKCTLILKNRVLFMYVASVITIPAYPTWIWYEMLIMSQNRRIDDATSGTVTDTLRHVSISLFLWLIDSRIVSVKMTDFCSMVCEPAWYVTR